VVDEKERTPNVTHIVHAWLSNSEFDGLFNEDLECGCKLDDLAPCGEIDPDCRAGYLIEPSPDPDYEFLISEEKPDAMP